MKKTWANPTIEELSISKTERGGHGGHGGHNGHGNRPGGFPQFPGNNSNGDLGDNSIDPEFSVDAEGSGDFTL